MYEEKSNKLDEIIEIKIKKEYNLIEKQTKIYLKNILK